jgi:heat shock protein 5
VTLYSIITHSGKSESLSESITITNEKGHLSNDDIDRMIREAEDFAAEDEVAR